MSKQVTLSFAGVTATITANDEGMFDLNDIQRTYGLPLSKQPNQWRHRDRINLERTAKLQVVKKGKVNKTLATQRALFMYAGWVSFEFQDIVYETFEAAASGDGKQAASIAQKAAKVRDFLREFHEEATEAIAIDIETMEQEESENYLKLRRSYRYYQQ